MGMSSNFINNCNLMIILLLGLFVVLGITYLIALTASLPKVKIYSLHLLKQGLITLTLFNSFNVAFSAGVHWKYANSSDYMYVVGTCLLLISLLVMVAAVGAMEFTS
jgi:hypothetical protein